MTLAHLAALDAFVTGPGSDELALVRELEAELGVILADGRGRPTARAVDLACEARLVLAAADAFFAVAERLTARVGGAAALRLPSGRCRQPTKTRSNGTR